MHYTDVPLLYHLITLTYSGKILPTQQEGLEEVTVLCVSTGKASFLWLCAVLLTSTPFFCPLLDKLCTILFYLPEQGEGHRLCACE